MTVQEFLLLKGHQWWDIPNLQGPMGRLMKETYRKAYHRDPPTIANSSGTMTCDCACYDRHHDMLLFEAAYRGLTLSDNYRRNVPLATQVING